MDANEAITAAVEKLHRCADTATSKGNVEFTFSTREVIALSVELRGKDRIIEKLKHNLDNRTRDIPADAPVDRIIAAIEKLEATIDTQLHNLQQGLRR